MNNIQKAFLFFALFISTQNVKGARQNNVVHENTTRQNNMVHDNKKKQRNVIPVQTIALGQLLKNIAKETSAFFYLVDKDGNPVNQQNFTSAIGSKSINIPNKENLNAIQQSLLNTLQVSVSENAGPWVQVYLNNVKTFRSKNLSGDTLNDWLTKWNNIASSYSSLLTKILHTITLSTSDAQTLNFMTKDNKVVTFLFFDDPFPAHTVPGNAQQKMKDLLMDFIKRYSK